MATGALLPLGRFGAVCMEHWLATKTYRITKQKEREVVNDFSVACCHIVELLPPPPWYVNAISEPGFHSSVVAPPSIFCANPIESVIT